MAQSPRKVILYTLILGGFTIGLASLKGDRRASLADCSQDARELIPFTVISRSEFRNATVSFDVRVGLVNGHLPTESQLKAISVHLKQRERRYHERTFVLFWLPGQVVGSGAYATAHHNPNLKVWISPYMTPAAYRRLASEARPWTVTDGALDRRAEINRPVTNAAVQANVSHGREGGDYVFRGRGRNVGTKPLKYLKLRARLGKEQDGILVQDLAGKPTVEVQPGAEFKFRLSFYDSPPTRPISFWFALDDLDGDPSNDEVVSIADARAKWTKQTTTSPIVERTISKGNVAPPATSERLLLRVRTLTNELDRTKSRLVDSEKQRDTLAEDNEQLRLRVQTLTSELADSDKQRDIALRLAEDANRELKEALRQAATANLQRDLAGKEAVTARQRVDAIRRTAKTQLEAIRGELVAIRNQVEVYKTRMERAEGELKYYTRREEAERRLATHHYLQGVSAMEKQDYPKAISSFTAAIEQYPKDARFFYMRAVVRHMTSESDEQLADATKDAQRGAELEKRGDSQARVVNRSLERHQGKSRLWLEKHRPSGVEAAARKTRKAR